MSGVRWALGNLFQASYPEGLSTNILRTLVFLSSEYFFWFGPSVLPSQVLGPSGLQLQLCGGATATSLRGTSSSWTCSRSEIGCSLRLWTNPWPN